MKIVLSYVLILSLMMGCTPEAPSPKPVKAKDPAVVEVPQDFLNRLKIDTVSKIPVSETLRVVGSIEFDEQRLARIGTNVAGRVLKINVALGHAVKKGDVLAHLDSSELSQQQLAYLKALANQELSHQNMERAKALFDADVISTAELQRRDSEYQIALAEAQALAYQLRLLGLSDDAIKHIAKTGMVNSVTPIITNQDGIVVERNLAQGQVVQPADTLFVVADLSRVWAVAKVPEQQIEQIISGQSVTIQVPALEDEKLQSKVIFVGQTVDPETRTVVVRTELNNKDRRLKPAMLASMLIEAKPVEQLVLPASAVIRENNEDFVFIVIKNNIFRLQKIKLCAETSGQRIVQSGLKGSEKIVIEGAFHLNNERKRQEMEGV